MFNVGMKGLRDGVVDWVIQTLGFRGQGVEGLGFIEFLLNNQTITLRM